MWFEVDALIDPDPSSAPAASAPEEPTEPGGEDDTLLRPTNQRMVSAGGTMLGFDTEWSRQETETHIGPRRARRFNPAPMVPRPAEMPAPTRPATPSVTPWMLVLSVCLALPAGYVLGRLGGASSTPSNSPSPSSARADSIADPTPEATAPLSPSRVSAQEPTLQPGVEAAHEEALPSPAARSERPTPSPRPSRVTKPPTEQTEAAAIRTSSNQPAEPDPARRFSALIAGRGMTVADVQLVAPEPLRAWQGAVERQDQVAMARALEALGSALAHTRLDRKFLDQKLSRTQDEMRRWAARGPASELVARAEEDYFILRRELLTATLESDSEQARSFSRRIDTLAARFR